MNDIRLGVICDPANSLAVDSRPASTLSKNSFVVAKFVIPRCQTRGPEGTVHPTVVVAVSGVGRRWYRYNSKTVELTTERGMVELYGRSFERDHARWEGDGGFSIGVSLRNEAVSRLAPHLTDFDIQTRHCLPDSRIEWLVRELYDEQSGGLPNGSLYTDGLSIALLALLSADHANRTFESASGKLSTRSCKAICDYVEENLGSDISVSDLAGQLHLGAHHFAELFKRTFGETPYQYVLRRRTEVATAMITSTSRSLAAIALELGFSSQSHFTQAYKKQTGKTPASLRNVRQIT